MKKLLTLLTLFLFVTAIGWYINDIYQSPVIISQKYEGFEDQTLRLQLKDASQNGKNFRIIIDNPPRHGSLRIEDSTITYTPDLNYYGEDLIKLHGARGRFHGRSATISIILKPVNDPPRILSKKIQLREDHKTKINLEVYDPDGDSVSYKIITHPQKGQLTLKDGQLSYQPQPDFFGLDQFLISADDGQDKSAIATIDLDVLPHNDSPYLPDQEVVVLSNDEIIIDPQATDVDSLLIQHHLVNPPKHGKVSFASGMYKYTPNRNYHGRDLFRIRASDGAANSELAEIRVEVQESDENLFIRRALSLLVKSGGVAVGDPALPDTLFQPGKYIPASILKIITALVALDTLGEDYRFSTKFYLDSSHNLIIKGFGDPMISTDTWYEIAEFLKNQQLFEKAFNHLVIDESSFSKILTYPGQKFGINYYNSPAGSLVTNFNTASIIIRKNKRITSRYQKTPVTEFLRKKAYSLPRGKHYLNIAHDSRDSAKYSSELIEAIFKKNGGTFQKKVLFRKVGKEAKLVYHYRSKLNLIGIIKKMLKDSNNFIANQIFLALALESGVAPANFEQSAKIVEKFLIQKMGLRKNEFDLYEGAGLSRNNKIELQAMLRVVDYLKPYKELLAPLTQSRYSSLVKVGHRWNILAKSGTLKRVANLVGFIETKSHAWKPFVIMLNQTEENRDKVMSLIGQRYF